MDLNKDKKIVVGMSGGIDSSMALVLLKKQGWQPIGVSLKLPVWRNKANLFKENVCCTKESLKTAKSVCKKINVPYYIVDAKKDFQKKVVDYFVSEWKNLRTPNPCVICNPNFKFKQLLKWARKHKIQYIATGHYARLRLNNKTKKYELLKANDKNKDQSYDLCLLPQKYLSHIIFPLGDYTKKKVYKIAQKEGFKLLANKKESQDFCFIARQSLCPFLKEKIGEKQGLILDSKGNTLSKHQGLHFFTLGQRKGIKLSGGPYFVAGWDKKKNSLFITKNKTTLYTKELFVFPYHLISGKRIIKPIHAQVKTRYQQKLSQAYLIPEQRKLKIILKKNIFAPCPGQFAVFYQKDKCLGGGRII
ncbi:MAG: tRNA 2-thiouridine(34) synthase MnmA [Candidatus Pacebacteria bacterium]|nr:tRNA 2-thiouridine(34) synthase MnmA [Candidatus Paceibacterota bacterium]